MEYRQNGTALLDGSTKSAESAGRRYRDPVPCGDDARAGIANLSVAKADPARAMLLTIVQAARMLGVGRSTLYELVAAGAVEVVHIGRSARIPTDALDEYVARLREIERART